MTTENIKKEIIEFTKRLNVEMLPSLAFTSKRAALDAIESLSNLVAVISEDEMKAAIDVDVEITNKIVDELDTGYDPSEDFTDEDIKANVKDPFGNDTLADVLESIDPKFDKNKLGKLKESSVKQYLTEKTVRHFVSDLKKIFLNPDDTALADKLGKEMARRVELRQGVPETERTDRLTDLKGHLINSQRDFINTFIAELVTYCNSITSKDINVELWGQSAPVVNALTKIYRSYIGDLKDAPKEERDAEASTIAKLIVLKIRQLCA